MKPRKMKPSPEIRPTRPVLESLYKRSDKPAKPAGAKKPVTPKPVTPKPVTPKAKKKGGNGKVWTAQKLSITPLDVLHEVRLSISECDATLTSWDHNHPRRKKGRSNKQIKIVGAKLLGREGDRKLTYAEAKNAVIEAVNGRVQYS